MSNKWSSQFWFVLESIVSHKNKISDEELRTVVIGIGKFLHCGKCRDHFAKYAEDNLLTNDTAQQWMEGLKKSIDSTKSSGSPFGSPQIKSSKSTQIKSSGYPFGSPQIKFSGSPQIKSSECCSQKSKGNNSASILKRLRGTK